MLVRVRLNFIQKLEKHFKFQLQIHRMYRSTGASLAKAQAEFTSGVMKNETVRQAAADAASASARSAFSAATSTAGAGGQNGGSGRF